jgi:hypothetical protein
MKTPHIPSSAPDGPTLRHSRILRLGADATGSAEADLLTALTAARTVISVDAAQPGTVATARLLLATLARTPGRLTLVTTTIPEETVAELLAIVWRIDPEHHIDNSAGVREHELPADTTLQVHLGTIAPRSLTGTEGWDQDESSSGGRLVRVVADGYGAQLARSGQINLTQHRAPNALGCMLAAAFAAGEAFAAAARVLPSRRHPLPHIAFCPVTLGSDLAAAPDLPDGLSIDAALLGLGAVGTAMAVILATLPLHGHLLLADRQTYAEENLGTYSLGDPTDVAAARPKVDLAADALRHRYTIARHHGELADLPARVDAGELPWPAHVLTGLDSIPARYAAQRLWADHHIDAATGDTTVGLHDAVPLGPCLQCFFPTARDGPSAEQRLAEELGIDPALLGRDEAWTEKELSQLPAAAAERLHPLVGTPKCGTTHALGLTDLATDDYRPSVPFVSQQAACLAVGRLLARLLGLSPTTNFFQYDTMIGPALFDEEPRDPIPACYCQARASIIHATRTQRAGSRGPGIEPL